MRNLAIVRDKRRILDDSASAIPVTICSDAHSENPPVFILRRTGDLFRVDPSRQNVSATPRDRARRRIAVPDLCCGYHLTLSLLTVGLSATGVDSRWSLDAPPSFAATGVVVSSGRLRAGHAVDSLRICR